jgi:hypothetical protein
MDVSCSAKAVIIKAGAGEERNGWIRQAHAACAFSRGPVAFTVVGRADRTVAPLPSGPVVVSTVLVGRLSRGQSGVSATGFLEGGWCFHGL